MTWVAIAIEQRLKVPSRKRKNHSPRLTARIARSGTSHEIVRKGAVPKTNLATAEDLQLHPGIAPEDATPYRNTVLSWAIAWIPQHRQGGISLIGTVLSRTRIGRSTLGEPGQAGPSSRVLLAASQPSAAKTPQLATVLRMLVSKVSAWDTHLVTRSDIIEKQTLILLNSALEAVRRDLAPRVEELAHKSAEGTLQPQELAEYSEIVRLHDNLSLLKLQAEDLSAMRAAS